MSTKKYDDEFSRLPVSNQRQSQLRNMANGKCPFCGTTNYTTGEWACDGCKAKKLALSKKWRQAHPKPIKHPKSNPFGISNMQKLVGEL